MNAGDSRDPITKADVDMTGELGRMTRPLVTRADLDAQAAAEEAGRPAKKGGILGGLFPKKPAEPAVPAAAPRAMAAPRIPAAAAPPAPRRMRASELRGSSQPRPSASPSSSPRGSIQSPPLGGRQRLAPDTISRGRGRVEELPPVVAGTTPDEFETKLVREIASMPPGRSGYTTIKTIEETLRSKAGQLGGTRKEVPMRLQRLEAMGLFKRQTHSRGTGRSRSSSASARGSRGSAPAGGGNAFPLGYQRRGGQNRSAGRDRRGRGQGRGKTARGTRSAQVTSKAPDQLQGEEGCSGGRDGFRGSRRWRRRGGRVGLARRSASGELNRPDCPRVGGPFRGLTRYRRRAVGYLARERHGLACLLECGDLFRR